jgi:hypothetical protein
MGRVQSLVQRLITQVVHGRHQTDTAAKAMRRKEGQIGFPLLPGMASVGLGQATGLGQVEGRGGREGVEESHLDDVNVGRFGSAGGGVGVGVGMGGVGSGGGDAGSDDEGDKEVCKPVSSQGCSRVFIVKGT